MNDKQRELHKVLLERKQAKVTPLPLVQKNLTVPCIHRSEKEVSSSVCSTCTGRVEIKVFDCSVHGKCSIAKKVDGVTGVCSTCNDYSTTKETLVASGENRDALLARTGIGRLSAAPKISTTSAIIPAARRKVALRYAYGITTVPERREELFPRTLASLKQAGFDTPRLFVDGDSDTESWRREFGLEVTSHYPKIRTYGNWVLGLAELYIRDPWADRFCIFQDDFVTYKNLRAYLDAQEMPDKGYWNLYTFPKNQVRAPDNGETMGWYLSNQKGLGAIALIFSRDAVTTLLHSLHMIERPKDVFRGWRAVDGGIVTAMNKAGWREYVHNPSLVQHLGLNSSMGNPKQALATSWLGEEYDCLKLLSESSNEQTTKSS